MGIEHLFLNTFMISTPNKKIYEHELTAIVTICTRSMQAQARQQFQHVCVWGARSPPPNWETIDNRQFPGQGESGTFGDMN